MRLTDRKGWVWSGEGTPAHVEVSPSEDTREAIRQVPAEALLGAWREPWLAWGLEPPRRAETTLRRELGKQVRRALKAAPRSQLRPLSEAAVELGLPERTLRSQIARGAREAQRLPGGALAYELPVLTLVRVRLPALQPDPRILALMAAEGCRPGERHRLGYRRLRSGEGWERAQRLEA